MNLQDRDLRSFRTVTEENFDFPPYAGCRACFEIIFPLCRELNIRINGEEIKLPEKSMLTVSPRIYTEIPFLPPGGSYASLCFPVGLVQNALSTPLPDFTYRLFDCKALPMEELLKNLSEEISRSTNQQAKELLLSSAVLKILYTGIAEGKIPPSEAKSSWVISSLDWINESCSLLSEEEIAAHFSVSYSYFSRSFKSVMGMSFTEYANFMRINGAKKLLFETDTDIGAISKELKFSSPSHFINVFHTKTGETPKKFRNRTREAFFNQKG